jgi:hypothetical protein
MTWQRHRSAREGLVLGMGRAGDSVFADVGVAECEEPNGAAERSLSRQHFRYKTPM